MTIRVSRLMRSMAANFLAIGLATNAWGQAGGAVGAGVTAGEAEGTMSIAGKIVCVACTTEEAQKAQPNLPDLYQLNHEGHTLVMQVDTIAHPARWEALIGLGKEVQVRVEDEAWQTITAEEHLFQAIGLSGVLSPTKTFDVTAVTLDGKSVSEKPTATP